MQPNELNVLLLVVQHGSSVANTMRDHIDALCSRSRHRVRKVQNYLALYGAYGGFIGTLPRGLPLEAFDVLVVHYSNYMALPGHFDQAARDRIRAFRGLKAAFVQDEYRTVDATVAALRDMNFDVLFTCVPQGEVEKVYPKEVLPNLTKVSTLTGFVPDDLVTWTVPPIRARPVDVGYRARVVPYWLGELGAEKWLIAPRFKRVARAAGLSENISHEEGDRLYGEAWTRFLLSCKAVLGVESGASVFDFSGELQKQVDAYVAAHPQVTFQEVQRRFLLPYEGRIRLNQISPRCFEAAALRTAMVLYEGKYSDVLQPWRHYVPLRKDFSNIDEVLAVLRDPERLQDMANRAYEEIALNHKYSYDAFVAKVDAVLFQEHERRVANRSAPRRISFAARMRMAMSLYPERMLPATVSVAHGTYVKLPAPVRRCIRPIVRKIAKDVIDVRYSRL